MLTACSKETTATSHFIPSKAQKSQLHKDVVQQNLTLNIGIHDEIDMSSGNVCQLYLELQILMKFNDSWFDWASSVSPMPVFQFFICMNLGTFHSWNKDCHLSSVYLPGHLFTCLVYIVTEFSTWHCRRDIDYLKKVQRSGIVKDNQDLLEERKIWNCFL